MMINKIEPILSQLFNSRHLFEVELLKYKAILEQRKFFGIERIEAPIMIGK